MPGPHPTQGIYSPGSEFPSCKVPHGGLISAYEMKDRLSPTLVFNMSFFVPVLLYLPHLSP